MLTVSFNLLILICDILIRVIPPNGVSARLWSISRDFHHKLFMRLPGTPSLLQKFFACAAALEGVSEVVIIANREGYFKSRGEYQPIRKSFTDTTGMFLLESFGRNAAAIAK